MVGGARFNQQGAGNSHLCLRTDPVFRTDDEPREYSAEVYGAEYEYPHKTELHDHEVPCAVCQVTRKAALMMPGTNKCDDGWSTEYVGYIAAGGTYASNHRTDFICVDDDAETTPVSNPANDDGILLAPAQTICGSLPCLPYVDYKDLLCVVCSR